MKVVLNGKETDLEILEIPFVALPELRKVCNEKTLRILVTAGIQRFQEQKHPLGDGIYCCRMIMPELPDEDKMMLFMLQDREASVPPVIMMLWREAVASGLLPVLQAMANEGSYRKGPGAIAFPELLRKSGVYVG